MGARRFGILLSLILLHLRHTLLLAAIIAALLASRLSAQTVITYTDGQNNSTAHDTSAPNNPTTLTIASGTATQSGVLSGNGTVIKTGSGKLVLSSNNTFTGGTTVNAGTLQLGDGVSFAALMTPNAIPEPFPVSGVTAVVVNSNAHLAIVANASITSGAGVYGTDGRSVGSGQGGAGVICNTGATITNNGTITGGDGGRGNFTSGGTGGNGVSVGPGGSLSNNGTINAGHGGDSGNQRSGGSGGTGVLFISGGTLNNTGTIRSGAEGRNFFYDFSSALPGNGVDFNSGGTLNNSGTIIDIAGGNAVLFRSLGTLNNTGNITGGTGSFGTTVTQGRGGTAVVFSTQGNVTNSGNITGGRGENRLVTASPPGGAGGTGIIFGSGGTLSNNGTIAGGTGGKAGSGSPGNGGVGVRIDGAAGTLINQKGGTIQGGAPGDPSPFAAQGAAVVMGNYANAVTLEIGSIINGTLNIGTSTAATLTLTDDGSGGSQNYAVAVTNNTIFSGSLIKKGSGTWTIDQSLTYSGNTTVNGGILKIAPGGSIANSANIIVGDAGSIGAKLDVTALPGGLNVGTTQTLKGNGQIDGNTNILGTHAPGNSSGIQTFTSGLAYLASSKFNWELMSNSDSLSDRGLQFDGVDVSGGTLLIDTAASSGLVFDTLGSTVDWSDAFWTANHQWLVFDNLTASSLANVFGGPMTVSNDAQGDPLLPSQGNFQWLLGGNDVYLAFNATNVPEPSGLLLLLSSCLGVIFNRFRRTNSSRCR